jgi:uncharacterized protein
MPDCPICKKPVMPLDDPIDSNRYFPFCGERCKLIDLGRWLSEKYGVPVAQPPHAADPSDPQNQQRE